MVYFSMNTNITTVLFLINNIIIIMNNVINISIIIYYEIFRIDSLINPQINVEIVSSRVLLLQFYHTLYIKLGHREIFS